MKTISSGIPVQQDTQPTPTIEIRHLVKNYYLASSVLHVLRDVNLRVYAGEFVAIMGPSGSGKSTFMNILGCLDRPTRGEYLLDGVSVGKISRNDLANVRNHKIGFVFQSFNLLSRMTTIANVELPLLYTTTSPALRHSRATQALSLVGLQHRMLYKPTQLSGGQQQRVAIARALVTSPSIILADEPTGNLDSHTSLEIMAILQRLNEQGITIVLVTHEPDIATYCKRQVHFRDGVILEDAVNTHQRQAMEELALYQASQQEAQV